jgi:leader peptidase (prepilin peptidase)/N-methyltransferase
MIGSLAFITLWTIGLGMLAERAARRRGVFLRAASTCWLAMVLLAVLAVAASWVKVTLAVALVAIAVAAVTDAQSGFIFDPLVIAGTIGSVVAAALAGEGVSSLYGAAAAAGAVFCIWALTQGRGIGFGDVKVAAVIGAGFGPLDGLSAVGLSFIIGSAIATARMFVGKARFGTSVRFGPYLLAGSVCLLAYHRLNDGVLR